MNRILLIVIILSLAGCDSANRIPQLEKDIETNKQELVRQQNEITTRTDEINNTKSQLEQAKKDLEIATKINDTTTAKIKELESKMNNLREDLGKEGIIMPSCLMGQSIIIYTKPYKDVQIFIGVVQKIKHGDKVSLLLSQTNQSVEVPFNQIVGYRMLGQ